MAFNRALVINPIPPGDRGEGKAAGGWKLAAVGGKIAAPGDMWPPFEADRWKHLSFA